MEKFENDIQINVAKAKTLDFIILATSKSSRRYVVVTFNNSPIVT